MESGQNDLEVYLNRDSKSIFFFCQHPFLNPRFFLIPQMKHCYSYINFTIAGLKANRVGLQGLGVSSANKDYIDRFDEIFIPL